MFDHLFNKWLISGEPVQKTGHRHNYTERARTVGWLPEDQRTTKQWEQILKNMEAYKEKKNIFQFSTTSARSPRRNPANANDITQTSPL